MSFECAACHEYVAGCGTDPPQFCNECDETPTCVTCKTPFEWSKGPACACPQVHGEWELPLP